MTRAPLARAAVAGPVVWLSAIALSLAGTASAQRPVPTDDPGHPHYIYPDSTVTVNDQCPVRGGSLNPLYRPVYVNGRPVGFC